LSVHLSPHGVGGSLLLSCEMLILGFSLNSFPGTVAHVRPFCYIAFLVGHKIV